MMGQKCLHNVCVCLWWRVQISLETERAVAAHFKSKHFLHTEFKEDKCSYYTDIYTEEWEEDKKADWNVSLSDGETDVWNQS